MNQLVCARAADVDVDGVRQSLSLSACIHLLALPSSRLPLRLSFPFLPSLSLLSIPPWSLFQLPIFPATMSFS